MKSCHVRCYSRFLCAVESPVPKPFPQPRLATGMGVVPNLLCFCLADILNKDGTINRKVLGSKVFGNQVKAGLL